MKKLEVTRGKHLAASFPWVDFTLTNTDIMSSLSRQPNLFIKKSNDSKYLGKIFIATLSTETLEHEASGGKGRLRLLSDVRLPLKLGRTYTVINHRYAAIDKKTTSLELDLTIELSLLMRPYVFFRRNAIDAFLNKICTCVENAARALETDADECRSLLNENQLARVSQFRAQMDLHGGNPTHDAPTPLDAAGLLRVAISDNSLVVTAEAKMPDAQILCAMETLPFDKSSYFDLVSKTTCLAGINNQAFSTRGEATTFPRDGDFRQAAFELGYTFYKRICSGQITEVLPALINRGQATSMRLTVSGSGEELPWESLHDGHDFLCLKMRFSRCLTSIHTQPARAEDWSNLGILIVGANPRGDLPGAEVEAEDIGNTLSRAGTLRVEVLTGRRATRQQVIHAMESGEFSIFHFSGHSIFESETPFQSHLELVGPSKIYLHEIGALGRSSRGDAGLNLAFLNSCQSALTGQDRITGRQMSLCRALREAGVNYVAGMLWNVEDNAAIQVGSTFYSSLLRNPHLGPTEAMRQTRHRVATDRAWSDGSWLAPVLYT